MPLVVLLVVFAGTPRIKLNLLRVKETLDSIIEP